MMIAVISAWFVQMTIHEIVYVVMMGNRFVTACFTVLVRTVVATAGVIRCALASMSCAFRKCVVINVIVMLVMHMSVMQIIRMTFVLNGFMPAAG
jgi:hypothetical protein